MSARPEEQVFIFIGQGGVHIVHAGELQQHQLLVDVIRRGGDGLTVDIKGFAAGQQRGETRRGCTRTSPRMPWALTMRPTRINSCFIKHSLSVFDFLPVIIYVFGGAGNRNLISEKMGDFLSAICAFVQSAS